MIELGSKVKCKVTGFSGIAISRVTYLNGCDRICVQPTVGKDGKIIDAIYFDEPQLEVIAKPKYKGEQHKPSMAKTGGPMSKSPSK